MKKTYNTPTIETIFDIEESHAIMATSKPADGDNSIGGNGAGATDDRKDEGIGIGTGNALSKDSWGWDEE